MRFHVRDLGGSGALNRQVHKGDSDGYNLAYRGMNILTKSA